MILIYCISNQTLACALTARANTWRRAWTLPSRRVDLGTLPPRKVDLGTASRNRGGKGGGREGGGTPWGGPTERRRRVAVKKCKEQGGIDLKKKTQFDHIARKDNKKHALLFSHAKQMYAFHAVRKKSLM